MWIGLIWLLMGTIGELLENCNGTWGSMKCLHFFWLAEELLAFRDGLYCVELFTYLTGYGTHSSFSYSKGSTWKYNILYLFEAEFLLRILQIYRDQLYRKWIVLQLKKLWYLY